VYYLRCVQGKIHGVSIVMGRKLNLNHLTDAECEQILKVIQRDFDIRQQEKGRLAYVPVLYTPVSIVRVAR